MKQYNDVRKKIEDYSYALVDIVCKGTLGTVFVGIHDKTFEKVAIKVIDAKTIKNLNDKYILENQTEALRKLNHPNIVKVMDIYSTTNNRYILTEYCEDGDLKFFLLKTKGNLTETEIMTLFRGIYQGFKYMNNKGFMHRRINPTNILLKNGICKINNFSMSRKDPGISKKENIPITNQFYCSPEVLESSNYSQKSDIWSLGVILYQMFHGSLPWPSKQNSDHLNQILFTTISYSKSLSDDARDFIKKCLTVDQSKRFSVSQLQNHPFISTLLGKDFYRQQCLSPLPFPKIRAEKLAIFSSKDIKQKTSVSQKIINQQINFMRYLYKLYSYIPRGPLKFLLLKQLLSNLQSLKGLEGKINSFEIENFDDFFKRQRTVKILQVISRYNIKYSKLYDQFKAILAKGLQYPCNKAFFNDQLQRSEALTVSVIQNCLRQIKQYYKRIKQCNTFDIDDNSILPQQPQKLLLTLDLLTTYYQLNCLLIDNWSSLEVFADASQVNILAQTQPSLMSKKHIRSVEDKLRALGII